MMDEAFEFIIIDDDQIMSFICEVVIQQAIGRKAEVYTFTQSDQALNYIKERNRRTSYKAIIFLDIYMPVTTGWDILNQINNLDNVIKKYLEIYILSSSVDPNDKNLALENSLVIDFIEKPLTVEKIKSIFGD